MQLGHFPQVAHGHAVAVLHALAFRPIPQKLYDILKRLARVRLMIAAAQTIRQVIVREREVAIEIDGPPQGSLGFTRRANGLEDEPKSEMGGRA